MVRALTGVDADRLPEEKRRGLTIDLGFAYATLPDGTEIGFVDVPGHERFLPNMLAGVLSIDRVLLIVAADDGPRPQTLEHLDILELIGIAEVTGVVTKIDRVEPERTEAVEPPSWRRCSPTAGFADSPIFPVSSRTGDGHRRRSPSICRESARIAERSRAAAAGIGSVPDADRPRLYPAGDRAGGDRHGRRRRGGGRRPADGQPARRRRCGSAACTRRTGRSRRAAAGERCAVNLAGSFPEGGEPRRGDWLVAPERHAPARRIDLAARASRDLPRRRCATGCRCICISARPTSSAVPRCSALAVDRPRRERFRADRSRAPDRRAVRRPGGAARPCGAAHLGRRARRRSVCAAARPPATGAARRARGARRDRSGARRWRALLAVEGVVELAQFALARNLAPSRTRAR